MTDKTNINKHKKEGISPIILGVTGAVIGAGIAIAGAVMLKDENKRNKAKKVINSIKNDVNNYVKKLENNAQKGKAEVSEKLAEGMGKAKKLATLTEKSLRVKSKEAINASKN